MTTPKRKFKPAPPEQLLQLLDHQRWLTSNGQYGKQLKDSEIEFEDLDLSGLDLSRVDLEHVTFRGGSLKGARFEDSMLAFAKFLGVDVENTNFTNANLRWATFVTNHEAARFDGADLTRTAWTKEQQKQNWDDYSIAQRIDERLWPRPKFEPK